MPVESISLTKGINAKHQFALIKSITEPIMMSSEERQSLFEGIELLNNSRVKIDNQNLSFKNFFKKYIDENYTNKFLEGLLASKNIYSTGKTLKKRILLEIKAKFIQEQWYRKDLSETRFLILYCLYWWNATAIGYMFEIEVFRDLLKSGIKFKAHNLVKPLERFSFADLTISGLKGDVKSSTYFFTFIRSSNMDHDFYITRYYDKNSNKYHWFVILKSEYWHLINGEAELIIFPRLPKNFIKPIKFEFRGKWWYAINYDTWKNKMLIYQKGRY